MITIKHATSLPCGRTSTVAGTDWTGIKQVLFESSGMLSRFGDYTIWEHSLNFRSLSGVEILFLC